MKIGLTGVNSGNMSQPGTIAQIARLAEELGYDSLWSSDHISVADPMVRFPPTMPMVDVVVSLTYLASVTKSIRLCTGIIILPQRQPVVLAKQLACVDVLSQGRLTVGIGVGWNEPELHSAGVAMNERGARTDEYLDAMYALWTQEHPEYHGKYVDFGGINAYPRPVQKPAIPLVVGGYVDSSYRRAVTRGGGWYGYGLDVDKAKQRLAGLREAHSKYQRPQGWAPLEITVCPVDDPDRDMVKAFEAIGVHRLALRIPNDQDADGMERFVREHAPEKLAV